MKNRINISILTGILSIASIFLLYKNWNDKKTDFPQIVIEDTNKEKLIKILANDRAYFYENSCRKVDLDNYSIKYLFNAENCAKWQNNGNFKFSSPEFEIKLINKDDNKIVLSFDDSKHLPKIYYSKYNHYSFTKKFIENEYDYIKFLKNTEAIKINLSKVNSYKEIVKITDSLEYSQIAFNTPSQMILEEESPITLLVSNFLTKQDLSFQLDSILGKSNLDSIETHRIKSTAFLEAHLTGQNFSVISGSPIRQPIFDYDVTKWEWIVEPKSVGVKYLVLTINVILDIKGKESPYTIQTFKKEINVKVKNKVWHFYKSNETLFLALLGIIFSFLSVYFGYWLGKKKKDEKDLKPANSNEEEKSKNEIKSIEKGKTEENKA